MHVPVRTCVGCRRQRPQGELVRCALVDGRPVVGRSPGRGAYVCGPGCVPAARKRRGFQRAWRADVPPAVLEQLEELVGRVANGAPAARLID